MWCTIIFMGSSVQPWSFVYNCIHNTCMVVKYTRSIWMFLVLLKPLWHVVAWSTPINIHGHFLALIMVNLKDLYICVYICMYVYALVLVKGLCNLSAQFTATTILHCNQHTRPGLGRLPQPSSPSSQYLNISCQWYALLPWGVMTACRT